MYPNPFYDVIYVDNAENSKANVFDVNGKSVLEKAFDNSSIDLSELDPGVYFLNINSTVFRVVKM